LKKFLNADRIIIVACGTSWHAGLVAEYVFEEFAAFLEVEYASEFRYRNPIINKRYRYCYFSIWRNSRYHAAIKLKNMEHLCLVFVMLWVLQFLEKLTQELIHAGPEIGVASTKARLKLQY
jgi:glucosamine--fructose-6-phosphate aminotransferase (isomerizing)